MYIYIGVIKIMEKQMETTTVIEYVVGCILPIEVVLDYTRCKNPKP